MGRNSLFVGGTPLLTQTYRPAEQVKVQAVIEFAIFGLVAATTRSSGWCYDRFAWMALNMPVVPLLAAVLLAVVDIERQMQAAVPTGRRGAWRART